MKNKKRKTGPVTVDISGHTVEMNGKHVKINGIPIAVEKAHVLAVAVLANHVEASTEKRIPADIEFLIQLTAGKIKSNRAAEAT